MKGLEPSLLEKLFDDTPKQLGAGAAFKSVSLDQYKESIARDLEGLLNSRAAFQESDMEEFPNCRQSLLTYGLADFSAMSLANAYDRSQICRSLEQAVGRHERRLKNINVCLDASNQFAGGLHFTIHALLDLEPAREPVSFDAMLQPSTLQYQVSRARRAQVS
ncbi:type VI secretion system baseplate subunit TssE [Stenotrophomonas sp. Iso1]|uniref:type VI secretion system baseplate subunit TssE n=1 Tax=Stenotrophomonas sp. Iso1 TaxID=2977283 RepID=UPI0022B7D474|nr:type VI secretion system baseplate subunit TssE [Stenotrophomonas sp. Iso1]